MDGLSLLMGNIMWMVFAHLSERGSAGREVSFCCGTLRRMVMCLYHADKGNMDVNIGVSCLSRSLSIPSCETKRQVLYGHFLRGSFGLVLEEGVERLNFTRYAWVYFLEQKFNAADAFRKIFADEYCVDVAPSEVML